MSYMSELDAKNRQECHKCTAGMMVTDEDAALEEELSHIPTVGDEYGSGD